MLLQNSAGIWVLGQLVGSFYSVLWPHSVTFIGKADVATKQFEHYYEHASPCVVSQDTRVISNSKKWIFDFADFTWLLWYGLFYFLTQQNKVGILFRFRYSDSFCTSSCFLGGNVRYYFIYILKVILVEPLLLAPVWDDHSCVLFQN